MPKTKKTNSRSGKFKHTESQVIDAIRGTGRWAGSDGSPRSSGGVIVGICDRLKCGRKTFYEYLKKRPAILEAYEDEKESMLDMAEESLFGLVQEGELGAICFFLKCKGKHRGWVEKQEVDMSLKQPPKVELILNASGIAPKTK